jgi:hypothetical protein
MKKFKTVAGYLRSMEDQLSYKQAMAELGGQHVMSDEDGERQIINNLLLQFGLADRIGADEKPRDGVRRLQQVARSDVQIKALAACLKWLNRPHFVSATMTAIHTVNS